MPERPIIYHSPVCPFSQRVEILLELKGLRPRIDFHVIDITVKRPDGLLDKTGGTTALPVMELEDGRILKESMVLLRYVDERWSDRPIARSDACERAMERLFLIHEGPFAVAGYTYVMNRDRAKTQERRDALLDHFAWRDEMLKRHNPEGTWLFDRFGLAEAVYTPMMMRFRFLEHYEGFALPQEPRFERVRCWREARLAHPAAEQVSPRQVVTLYYDYAVAAGNGALPEGRSRSSFVFTPDWSARPLPPADKYDRIASDAELRLA